MASDPDSSSATIQLSTSPNTALAYLPPVELLDIIQQFRSVYDQAGTKWPPHINILYPFVPDTSLSAASSIISQSCSDHFTVKVSFIRAEAWRFKSHVTIVLIPSIDSSNAMEDLDEELSHVFPRGPKAKNVGDGTFKPHLTIGQAPADDEVKIESLRRKAEMLCERLGETTWSLSSLVRKSGNMKLFENFGSDYDGSISLSPDAVDGSVIKRPTYRHDTSATMWAEYKVVMWSEYKDVELQGLPTNITVGTYNVMYELDNSLGRYKIAVSNIIASNADVLVLQEVTDGFLEFMMCNVDVATKYPYCTHCPGLPLVRMHNCVLLSSQPFEWEELVVDKTKSAVIAKFGKVEEGSDRKGLVVCGVHLPAHLTESSIARKRSYYKTVDEHLSKIYPEQACIVAGDFNLHEEDVVEKAVSELGLISREDANLLGEVFPPAQYVNAWQAAGDDVYGSSGATFDPFTNDLARQTAEKHSKLPLAKHSFDKILVRTEGSENVNIREAKIFGKPKLTGLPVGSDHYGLTAEIHFKEPQESMSEEPLELMEAAFTTEDVKQLVLEEGLVPTAEDTLLREQAVSVLKRCLRGDSHGSDASSAKEGTFKMELRVVGSTAIGTYDGDSDIDCLVAGNITAKVFWKVARQRIRRWGGADGSHHMGIKVVRYVDAAVPMLVLLVGGSIRVDLQYCTAVRLVEAWQTRPNIPPTDPLFNLPVMTLKKLRPVRDMDHILSVLPHLPNFRLAYRFIKLWAMRRGIYSSKFGYLGGIHITLMLARICILLPADATVPQLLRVFFNQYANWDWADKEVVLPILPRTIRYQRGAREPMVILTITTPATNAAFNASRHTVHAIQREMRVADSRLATLSGDEWSSLFGESWRDSAQAGAAEFLSAFPTYIKVELQFWGQVKSKGRALVGFVESRCVMLLVLLAEKFPGVSARIWPKRFREVSSSLDGDKDSEELRGFYLIGLTNSSETTLTKGEKKLAESKITEAIRTFETTLKNNMDESTTFLQVSAVKRSELSTLKNHTVKIDDSGIWDGNVGEEESIDALSLSDDEDEEIDNNDEAAAAASLSTNIPPPGVHRNGSGGKKRHENNGRTPKLRTSLDIYNRLMWDDKYDSSDYLIGYEDRFKGVMEMDVVNWKTEMSDEEFVPMHRVVYFKRKSDGVKVWDRVWKKDLIFGSGVV